MEALKIIKSNRAPNTNHLWLNKGELYYFSDGWKLIKDGGGGTGPIPSEEYDKLKKLVEKNTEDTAIINGSANTPGSLLNTLASSKKYTDDKLLNTPLIGDVENLENKVNALEGDIEGVSEDFDTFAELYNTYKTEILGPTVETVNNHTDALNKVVKTISTGGTIVNPVKGVATITYDAALSKSSTNAPQTKTVWTAFNAAQEVAVLAHQRSKLSILTSETINDTSVLKRYILYQGRDSQNPTSTPGIYIGTIDIPKDLVITSGKLVIGDGNNDTILGEQYLKLNFGKGEPVYIAVGDLANIYTSGKYIIVDENGIISVNITDVDAELVKDTSAVGGRIKDVEDTITTLYTDNFTKEGTIVNIISGAITKLIEGTVPGVENHSLSELKSVAEAAYTPDGDIKIARADLDKSTKDSLYLADNSIQRVLSGNINQIGISKSRTTVTIIPVVAVVDDLKNGTNSEKLLTASVAKNYIDSLWEWESLD